MNNSGMTHALTITGEFFVNCKRHGLGEAFRYAVFSTGMWLHRRAINKVENPVIDQWWDTSDSRIHRSWEWRTSQVVKQWYQKHYG